jgi:hypothetical protein
LITEYEQKVNDFIKEHKITEINSNPTQKYQKRIMQILKYIGQTGRTFHTRYKEHILAIKKQQWQLRILKPHTKHRT